MNEREVTKEHTRTLNSATTKILILFSIFIFLDSEQGSWESGLSYECRSLLFKALHNLIERYGILHI